MHPPYSLPCLLSVIERGFGEGRRYYRVRDVILLEEAPAHAVLLRFDVERNVQHQLRIATFLAEKGVFCTFYFHARPNVYDVPIMRRVQELGHEVGYHHECLDRCGGNFATANELFLQELAQFRKDGLNICTVCSHGEAGLAKHGYKANKDLFDAYPELLADQRIVEAYHWVARTSPLYASDTFRAYRGFWSTIQRARSTSRPFMVLAHLHRWHYNPLAVSLEVARDLSRQIALRLIGTSRRMPPNSYR